jgi:hypothetical protein
MCVQRFDDSQCSAIHTTFRASLRSSSMQEPRDPLLKVLILGLIQTQIGRPHEAAPDKGAKARASFHGCVGLKAQGAVR